MAALRHQRCGRASRPSRQSFRKKLAALALGHWCLGAGHSQGSRKSPLSPSAQGTCVCLFHSVPRRVPLTCGGIDYYYANNGPGLQHAGLGPLSPRGGSPSAQGGSDGPGLRPATWTHQIGRVCRLPVLAACLPPLSLLQLLWKASALGAPGQSTGQGPAAAQVFRRKGLGPIAPHPGTQGLIPFSVPALPLYPWPLNPRPTGILKHPE